MAVKGRVCRIVPCASTMRCFGDHRKGTFVERSSTAPLVSVMLVWLLSIPSIGAAG